jgi:beta-aspartyl-peptidase (threonine type)
LSETSHVLLSGSGADEFSIEVGEEQVANSWFTTERRRAQWKRKQEKSNASAQVLQNTYTKINKYGTVGCVVLDTKGNLAAGTSTGGMTGKKYGRVGDSPIIGAGTYANNASCALSATGTGEEFIRHGVCRDISSRMLYQGVTLNAAADSVIYGTLREGDGGIIGVSKDGEIAMTFNSVGMFRGAANAEGRYEVLIWEPKL